LLPWVIPPIAMVGGIRPAFRAAPWFLGSDWSLVPFYVIIAMPFTYRSLDAGLRALDLRTMVDASKSLGAGWWRTIVSVIMPNMTSALIGASFLTATVVLGEFTIASLLLKETLPTQLVTYSGSDARGGTALALALLFLSSVVLIIFTKLLRRRGIRIDMAASA
jgi:putative spermidine/putrescine transport system permease protein